MTGYRGEQAFGADPLPALRQSQEWIMDFIAYQEALAQATRDIHDRCGVEVSVLWDDGKLGLRDVTHTVRIWNGLGSVELELTHANLLARGEAYRHFLDRVVAVARKKLTLL